MTLRERQDQFVETIGMFDEWRDKFDFLMDYSELLPRELPENLAKYRIKNCKSRTFFKVSISGGRICTEGWSNSVVMGGIIVAVHKLFDGVPVSELNGTAIDFHEKSGLVNNLTPMRHDALLEIVNRILVLSNL
jgi:cysteine desulfuration protein SufE